jgi:hypothetical protein
MNKEYVQDWFFLFFETKIGSSCHANVATRCFVLQCVALHGAGRGRLVSAALRARGTLRVFAGVSWLKVSFP